MKNTRSMFLMLLLAALISGVILVNTPQMAVGQSGDGRLNCDPAAPIVLYCTDEGLDIYRVYHNGRIDLTLRVPQPIMDNASQPATYTELARTIDGSIIVYLLNTGQIQVNALNRGELYTAVFWGCPDEAAWISVYNTSTWELLSRQYGTCGLPEGGEAGPVEMCTIMTETEAMEEVPCSEIPDDYCPMPMGEETIWVPCEWVFN